MHAQGVVGILDILESGAAPSRVRMRAPHGGAVGGVDLRVARTVADAQYCVRVRHALTLAKRGARAEAVPKAQSSTRWNRRSRIAPALMLARSSRV